MTRTYQFIIFITIALAIYSSLNFYIYIKGLGSVPLFQRNRIWYLIIFLLLAVSFIAGKFLEASHSSILSDALNIIGGFWLAFMLYGFLFLILTDIVSVILRLTGLMPAEKLLVFRKWTFISILAVSFLLIAGGFINALIPKVRQYDISIAKPAGSVETLRIAAVSDIHLGSIIRKRSMNKLSAVLKDLKPDLVLLLGDIVDGEMGPVIRGDLLKYFRSPECTDGLYAITGNHEYIGGAKRTIPYIESKGIRILKDEIVTLEGGIQLIGRLDRDSKSFSGQERKSLGDLMQNIDLTHPVILLDHQPLHLEESAKYGVDLQLSGHTHNGQMWPLNHVVKWIYELSYGYLQKGGTQYIVSSGFGLWGPRVRSGSRSEILLLNIRFANNAVKVN